jgi:ankyrin repeat protein
MRALFADEDFFESRQFPIFHKIVLGLHGADLKAQLELSSSTINDKDSDGRTALSWAAARGDPLAVRELLDASADPNICAPDLRTPLHWAAQSGNAECLQLLIRSNAIVNCVDFWARTPLIYAACNHDNPEALRVLIDAGADLNSQDCRERTALGYAAKHNHAGNVNILLDRGADPDLADNWGFTPLFEVLKPTHHASLEILRRYTRSHGGRTIKRQTILHLLAAGGDAQTVKFFENDDFNDVGVVEEDENKTTAEVLMEKRVDKPEGFEEAFRSLVECSRAAGLSCVDPKRSEDACGYLYGHKIIEPQGSQSNNTGQGRFSSDKWEESGYASGDGEFAEYVDAVEY